MYYPKISIFVLGLFWTKSLAQLAQICNCVVRNQCYQQTNGSTGGNDGSGVIDIRIVNPGDLVTIPPAPQPTIGPGLCPAGFDLCCYGPGVVGCGLRNNIPITAATTPTGGQMKYGNQPWQILIMSLDNTQIIGGGVLLDASNVLTAAHKVVNRSVGQIKIRAGEWNLQSTLEPFPVQESIVAQIRIHPNYQNVTNPNLQNNVALLRLATPITFNNPAINTICLPTSTSVFDGQRCIVAGWGRDSFTGVPQIIPKEVEVPVVPYADCQNRLRTTRLGASFNLDQNSFLCAGGEPARDACVGDGGAGLACIVGGRYQLAGLVAWGIGCGDNNIPGVYVRVSSFLSQIQTWLAT